MGILCVWFLLFHTYISCDQLSSCVPRKLNQIQHKWREINCFPNVSIKPHNNVVVQWSHPRYSAIENVINCHLGSKQSRAPFTNKKIPCVWRVCIGGTASEIRPDISYNNCPKFITLSRMPTLRATHNPHRGDEPRGKIDESTFFTMLHFFVLYSTHLNSITMNVTIDEIIAERGNILLKM